MFLIPFGPIIGLIIDLISLALVGLGLFWVIGWFFGVVTLAALFYAGIAMLVFSLSGRYLALLLLARPGTDEPTFHRSPEFQRIKREDGTELHVEFYGPPDAQPILFTHGIATNSTDWYYAKRHLADRFRLVLWDVTGLGKSSRSPNHNYSTEKMASDLEAVLQVVNKPAILVGHSMGGMITLTFCKLFPQHLGTKVAGLGLVDTTYTNPVKTATARGLLKAIQKPILEPLLHLIIFLSPIVWVQNWLSYFNGMSYIPSRIFSFAGQQTRGQLDFMTVCQPMCSPAVLARQMLGMFYYDATETLNRINVPTLIVTADTDRACIPEASQYMHSQIPNSELIELPKCGHVSIMEQNKLFTQALGDFSARVAQSNQSRRTGAA